ncbi:uncharacterized protein BYT42DRAFT_487573 [Radiomyces spectabilis]|uniref:uncharacterized protein n=1 Tax=Radiomyces spectabilis TaxID=64574 RepID=UPI00221FEA32|nr:uncharacterized protein BYT42DRAFT_487573 [Radiomyces spectabilis]KAI8393754.1 hypothetical protein BYT42DRAFT_487573 [Radiomyces spectabilis]
MHLVPRELDKLLIHQGTCQQQCLCDLSFCSSFSIISAPTVGSLAQQRLIRGIQLNHAEANALIVTQLLQYLRTGRYSVPQLLEMGKQILGRRQVRPEVSDTLQKIHITGNFPDGSRILAIDNPICTENGNLEMAFYGTSLSLPDLDQFPSSPLSSRQDQSDNQIIQPGMIDLNVNRKRYSIAVVNHGSEPVRVGSHNHFMEVHAALSFNRALAYGMRLDIPAGASINFQPGDYKVVALVEIGGKKIISGDSVASGPVDMIKLPSIMMHLLKRGYLHDPKSPLLPYTPPCSVDRQFYAQQYGPTTGDMVRLGNTQLCVSVEKDYTVYGDECKFPTGKIPADDMRHMASIDDKQALDLVITNALVIDSTGIIKADIGIKEGAIVGVGKAGNPDTMDGVTSGMILGPNTEILAGEGKMFTAGGIHSHADAVYPDLSYHTLASGVTTLIACPNDIHSDFIAHTMKATDSLPINFAVMAKSAQIDKDSERSTQDKLEGAGAISAIHSSSSIVASTEIVEQTWQTANIILSKQDKFSEDSCRHDNNYLVKRSIAAYTSEAAATHGISHMVGSLVAGNLADIVCYQTEFFGSKPDCVLKSGVIAWSSLGNPHKHIPTMQSILARSIYDTRASKLPENCILFTSKLALTNGSLQDFALRKRIEAVQPCPTTSHSIGVTSMVDSRKDATKAYSHACKPVDTLPLQPSVYLF